jgi:hypothetical protein
VDGTRASYNLRARLISPSSRDSRSRERRPAIDQRFVVHPDFGEQQARQSPRGVLVSGGACLFERTGSEACVLRTGGRGNENPAACCTVIPSSTRLAWRASTSSIAGHD